MTTMERKNKPPVEKAVSPKETRDTAIPQNELEEFLSDKIPEKERKKVWDIVAGNVWSNRYRLNVWMEEYTEGSMCPKVWIGYSYFIHYHEGMIIDKTEEEKPKQGRIF